ncbi:MAG: hypothetical protein KatS3mg002_0111 [Candidatus Woesearchaeota archaeon]|nr:MAG: hypothetical protein KatS3mg002_0111 [Candidatus Woesearchaeota archaeon]
MGFRKLFKSQEFWIFIIFLAVLTIRIIIAFQTPLFNYEAYFSLRQIENIKETGFPTYNDPLSYGGKIQLFTPLNYYILTLFSLIIPEDIVAKIIPNIFASLLIIVAYFMALKITKNPKIGLITGFMTGFIPILFFDINRISTDYFSTLIIFSIIYCLFKINERKYIDYSLILMFILVLTTPLALILILGLLFYLLLSKLENNYIELKELEIILFFTFLTTWINLLIFKNALLTHGIMVIWQNMPTEVISRFFSNLTLLETFYTISIIPLLLGIYGFYLAFNEEKNREVMILTGFGIAVFLLMWFRLLNLITSIFLLSVTLVIISSFSLKRINGLIEISKFHKYKKLFILLFIVLFILTSTIPSIILGMEKSKETPKLEDIVVLQWAEKNTPKTAVIAGTLEEGHLITYYAKRKNIADNRFLLVQNIDQRIEDINKIYATRFQIESISILNKYNSKYILLTDYARKKYNIDKIYYINEDCFQEIVYSKNTTLYMNKCKIEK